MATGDLDATRRAVVIAHRVLAHMGVAAGACAALGHVSQRLPGDPTRFVVRGCGPVPGVLRDVRPEHLVVCDLNGDRVDGPPGFEPPAGVHLHAAVYRARPAVHAVAHAHPAHCVRMGILGQTLVPMVQEGSLLVRRPLPVHRAAAGPHDAAAGDALAATLGEAPAVILRGHGAATTGAGVVEACMALIHLEHQAEMNYYGYLAEGPDHGRIPDENLGAMGVAGGPAGVRDLPHFQRRLSMTMLRPYDGFWSAVAQAVAGDL